MNATGIPNTPVASNAIYAPSIEVCDERLTANCFAADDRVSISHRSPNVHQQHRILVATQLTHSGFLKGIARYARESGWQLITDMLHTGVLPRRWDGDGVLAFAPYQSDITSYVTGTDIPCVTVSMTDECKSVPRIEPDNIAIGRLAARHLIRRNCREFIWAPFINDSQNRDRFIGFQREIEKLGCRIQQLPPAHKRSGHHWQDDWQDWRSKVGSLFSTLSNRVGLFAFNDCLSAELATIAREVGLEVPEQLAILGVGNEHVECESSPVALSSVDPNVEEMAYQAASLLSDILNGQPSAIESIKIAPKQIVARDSTALSAEENPRIQQAMVFIAESYSDPSLSVTSVADALGISRRQLERDFRTEKGYTIREYIEDTRMSEASRLLIDQPDKNVGEIARLVGIYSSGNFFRIFRKRFGHTPASYREKTTRENTR
ncbi:substrate-binding domain-containing protein [Pelagicoccus sp. SDUM812003]|uniref:AraC family transcriptional regulator n=1 Tax=Pelagicoccus sp. SDUM812003 TaxID=3041267 RepID=UPI00280F534B|nr:substrate-binding domain-containing protein [Pelagicoccus sp. SDUM812003]MDQ8203517.1 substrate-binding domain-containing protein [Pelagicoccus sp. SDUM812003]